MPDIVYAEELELTVEDFVTVLNNSGLGPRRPVADSERIRRMLANSNVLVTARKEGVIVGVSRGMTDHGFSFYLSDLAVVRAHQGLGIGQALVAYSHRIAGLETMLVLLAAPGARTYYSHIGMEQHPSCWMISSGVREFFTSEATVLGRT